MKLMISLSLLLFSSLISSSATNPQRPCIKICLTKYQPVCGTDGVIYANKCVLEAAACHAALQGINLQVAYEGECFTSECPLACTENIYEPVCASDYITYANECLMKQAVCEAWKERSVRITKVVDGMCSANLECTFGCLMRHIPMCGTDGITYSNDCMLRQGICEAELKEDYTLKLAHAGDC